MQLGMIGLGRMGSNMVRRLMRGGHTAVAYDRNPENVKLIAREGAAAAMSLDEFVAKLAPPKVIWLMLPAGQPTEETVVALSERLSAGDVLIETLIDWGLDTVFGMRRQGLGASTCSTASMTPNSTASRFWRSRACSFTTWSRPSRSRTSSSTSCTWTCASTTHA